MFWDPLRYTVIRESIRGGPGSDRSDQAREGRGARSYARNSADVIAIRTTCERTVLGIYSCTASLDSTARAAEFLHVRLCKAIVSPTCATLNNTTPTHPQHHTLATRDATARRRCSFRRFPQSFGRSFDSEDLTKKASDSESQL